MCSTLAVKVRVNFRLQVSSDTFRVDIESFDSTDLYRVEYFTLRTS